MKKKIEEDDSQEIAEREDLELILETLEAKQTILKNLDEKILADTLEEDTEKEILVTDRYNFTLHTKLRKFRKHILALEPTAESYSNIPFRGNDHGLLNCSENSCGQQPFTISRSESNHHSGSKFHNSPILDLPVFEGNVLEWQLFWDLFESAIHSNNALTDVQKFNY
jgi:hypothetical protein